MNDFPQAQTSANYRLTVLWPNFTHLSGLSRGLDKRHSVASCQLLSLTRLHCSGTQVTLIPHQHHGNAVTVLHPVNLLSTVGHTCNSLRRYSPFNQWVTCPSYCSI